MIVAVLPQLDRDLTAAHWMRTNTEATAFTRADLKAAVDATDTWIDANTAAWNAALPVAFRTAATANEKTLLFMQVVMRRAGLLPTAGG